MRVALATLNGDLRIEYTTNNGLFPTYLNQSSASTSIQDALYGDDLTLVAESRQELQHMVNAVSSACKQWGMTISATKAKTLSQTPIMLQGQPLDEVEFFSYLGSEISQSNKAEKEVLMRLEKASKTYLI